MWDSGNFQQQSLMLKIHSICKTISVWLIASSVLTSAACTRMPVQPGQPALVNTDFAKMQTVAQTSVGATARYTDTASGAAVEILVLSEYFSAAGRKCRRFSEVSLFNPGNGDLTDGQAVVRVGDIGTQERLACDDVKKGWIEIPVDSITG